MILIILLGGEKLKNAFLSSCLNQNLYPITGSEGVNAVFGSDAFGNTAFAQNGTIGGLRYGVAFGFGSFDESCGSFQVASKMLNSDMERPNPSLSMQFLKNDFYREVISCTFLGSF